MADDQEHSSKAVTDVIPVPEEVCGLLFRLADGWTPTTIQIADIDRFSYGDMDISDAARELRVEEDRLLVNCSAPLHRKLPDELVGSSSTSFRGRLANGFNFEADDARIVKSHKEWPEGAPPTQTISIAGFHWKLSTDIVPSVWITRLDGELSVGIDANLVINWTTPNGTRRSTGQHYRLSGHYTYYLAYSTIDEQPTWHLVIDTATTGMPNEEILERDFLVLQFAFGCQMRCSQLLGLDANSNTVAIHPGLFRRQWTEATPCAPVPRRQFDHSIRGSWAALLFERVSAAWKKQKNPSFEIALEMYLDALTDNIDSNYMRLQIALESFAYWLLQSEGKSEIVENKESWKRWVKENEVKIRSFAKPGFENSLVEKVRGVYRLASGRVVPNAFTLLGISPTKEMLEELKGRDPVVHQGIMSDAPELQRDHRRERMVRTMLVALVAKASHYNGAINGWELDEMYNPKSQGDWWSIDGKDHLLAKRQYVAGKRAEISATHSVYTAPPEAIQALIDMAKIGPLQVTAQTSVASEEPPLPESRTPGRDGTGESS